MGTGRLLRRRLVRPVALVDNTAARCFATAEREFAAGGSPNLSEHAFAAGARPMNTRTTQTRRQFLKKTTAAAAAETATTTPAHADTAKRRLSLQIMKPPPVTIVAA